MTLEITQKSSPEQGQRLEALAERRDNLQAALNHLMIARGFLDEEGEIVPPFFLDLVRQIEALILQAQDEAMEIQVGML